MLERVTMIARRMNPTWMPMIERERGSREMVVPLRDRDWDVILFSNSMYMMPAPAMRMPPDDIVVEFSIFTTGNKVNVLSIRQPTAHDITSDLFSLKNRAP